MKRISIFGLLLTSSLVLRAQTPIGMLISEQSRTGFTVQGAGARAMGLGGAFIAVADDATAVSFNPAGLAQLMKPEISFVGRGVNRNISYEEFETTSHGRQLAVSDSLVGNSRFDPLLISSAVPLRLMERNLCLQISVQRAFALGEGNARTLDESPVIAESASAPSRLEQSINQSGQIDIYSAAMAYECSERILLGASFNFWKGSWDLDSRSAKTTAGVQDYIVFHQNNRLSGQNLNLGLIWRWPAWSLGFVYRTPFNADYSFRMLLDTNVKSTGGLPASGSPVGADIGLHWPSVVGAGLAVRPWEGLLITGDMEYAQWSSARFMTSNPRLNGLSFFGLDRKGSTPNSTVARIGAEYVFLMGNGVVVPLRVGLSREPQPVVDSTTGEQRVMYGASIGTGIKRGMFTFDIAYRHSWANRRASQFLDLDQIVSGSSTTSLGQEHTKENRLDLSFIFQFNREPVVNALRYLFVGD